MQIGIFAKTFAGTDPQHVLNAVAKAGFACTQYNMACSGLPSMPDDISEEEARAVAKASATTGVSIVAVSGTYNMIHPDIEVRRAGHRRLDVIARQCRTMSTGLITLCTGTRDATDQWKEHPDNNTPEAWRDLLDAMAIALDIAERHEVDLGIEPELANVINSAEKAHRLIEDLQSLRLKIVLDPANLFERVAAGEQRRIVASAIDLLADRIVMAHAKDRNPDGSFATAGKGVLDYPHYLGRLKAIGFDKDLVTHGLDASEAAGVAAFLTQCLHGAAP